MPLDVSRRPPTPEDAAFIKRRFGIGVESWFDTLLIPMIPAGGACFVVMVAVGLGLRFFRGTFLTPTDIIWMLGLAFGAGVVTWLRVFVDFRRRRQRERIDVREQTVEVIRVSDARLIQLEEHNDEGPLYYFGAGSDKVLFLGGQWLWDWSIYGLPDPDLEDDEEDNGPPFPASSFTLSRLPRSGQVLGIHITGAPLTPEATISRKAPLPSWARACRDGLSESCLTDGSFDDLK